MLDEATLIAEIAAAVTEVRGEAGVTLTPATHLFPSDDAAESLDLDSLEALELFAVLCEQLGCEASSVFVAEPRTVGDVTAAFRTALADRSG